MEICVCDVRVLWLNSVFKTQAFPYLLSRSRENLTGCPRYLCDKAVVLGNTIKVTPSVTLYVTSTHAYRRLPVQ